MDEQTLRHLLRDVASGHLSRRRFTQVLIGLGLTAPMAMGGRSRRIPSAWYGAKETPRNRSMSAS